LTLSRGVVTAEIENASCGLKRGHSSSDKALGTKMKLEFHLLDEDPAPQPQMRKPTQTYVVDNVLVDPDDLFDFKNVSLFCDILLEQEYGKHNYRLVRGRIESDDWEWALMWRIRVEFPHIYDKDRLVWVTLLDEKDWPLDFQVAHEAAVDAWMWAEIKKWGEANPGYRL